MLDQEHVRHLQKHFNLHFSVLQQSYEEQEYFFPHGYDFFQYFFLLHQFIGTLSGILGMSRGRSSKTNETLINLGDHHDLLCFSSL